MYKEPKAMKEIHDIRERIYEETKNMTNKEIIKYIHKAAEEAKRKHGFNLRQVS